MVSSESPTAEMEDALPRSLACLKQAVPKASATKPFTITRSGAYGDVPWLDMRADTISFAAWSMLADLSTTATLRDCVGEMRALIGETVLVWLTRRLAFDNCSGCRLEVER